MRKILCVVLILIICSFTIFSYAEDTNNTTNTSNDLQTQQQQLQNQIQDANEKLEDVQSELSENLQQVQKLDEKITSSQTELEELNTKIIELQISIDEVEVKLKIAQEKYDKQKEILDTRLVAMYESGDTQYLDVILASKNMSEFLSNYFLIGELATYDTELLDEMKTQKDEIELSKQRLDNAQKEYATIKQNQTKTAKILENTKTVRENYISKLSDKEKEVQTQIDEYTAQFAKVNAEILAASLRKYR